MRGFAITISVELARAGYDVYGPDTRQYLKGSSGASGLSIPENASDFGQMARLQIPGQPPRVLPRTP
jgi:hypothetical protein